MRKRFYFIRGCLLFTVFTLFFGGSPYNKQANKTLSPTVSTKLGVQDARVLAKYDDFIEKFKSTPPKGMAFIPAGTFMMGSEHGSSDEKPAHSVTLGPFFIDKFEVTQKEFEKVMGFNPSIFKSGTFTGGYLKPGESNKDLAKFMGDDRPVERVSWHEAKEYCQSVGKRLPTEAEWEYAAKAGGTTNFYWGDKTDVSFAWTAKNARSRSHLVGQKKPNAFGLYDISGNVWEWMEDWYEKNYYSENPALNPKGPATGTSKVMRGGSWYAHPNYSHSTYRAQNDPMVKYTDMGFRCVLAPLW